MTAWRWVGSKTVYAVDDRQLAEHGGLDGIRDQGAVRNLAAYTSPDVAAYAYGLARNHGFIDGNKRTAWVTARLFLADNGYRLRFDKHDAVRTMEAVAAGTFSEGDLAVWFRKNLILCA